MQNKIIIFLKLKYFLIKQILLMKNFLKISNKNFTYLGNDVYNNYKFKFTL